MATPTRRAAAGAAGALVLTLTACSGEGPAGGESSETLTWADSPLDAYYQSLFDSIGMDDANAATRDAERQRQQEDLTAQCMTEQGFDYTPVHYPDDYYGVPAEEAEGEQQSQLEYAQQWGYDVFTHDYANEEPVTEEESGWEDPNAWVYDELTDSELRAWEEALWGAPPEEEEFDPDADVEDYEWNWEDAGCRGWAQHELEADDPWAEASKVFEDPQFAELLEEMNNIYQEAETDPRFGELDGAWSACMADQGYDFADPQAARESIYGAHEAFWEDHADDPEYMGPSYEETADIREQEIATAVADYTCQEKLGYESEQLRVRFDAEQAFIDANKERLDQFAAAVEAAVPAP